MYQLKLKFTEKIKKNQTYYSIAKEFDISKGYVAVINKRTRFIKKLIETNLRNNDCEIMQLG